MFDHIVCPNDTDIWEKMSAQLLSLAFSVLVTRDVYSDDVTIKRHNTALLVVEPFKERLNASKPSEHPPDRGTMRNVWVES